MSSVADIFLVNDTSKNDPVDQLGQIDNIGPYPSSTSEVVHDRYENHRTNDNGESVDKLNSDEGGPTRDNLLSPLFRIQKCDSIDIPRTYSARDRLPVLQQFFDISYMFCTSPFTRHTTGTCCRQFRLVVYWLLIPCSCLDALISTNVAFNRKDIKAPHRYTTMGFHSVELVCRLYHVLILWKLSRKLGVITNLMLRLDDSFLRLTTVVRRHPMELPSYNMLIVIFGILPMLAATMWGVFDFWTIKEWNLLDVLYEGARDLGRTFLVWDMGQEQNANNKTENLLFVNTPDAVWISLGMLRIVGKIAANLQDFAMRNLLLAISLSLIKHTIPLSKVFKILRKQLVQDIQLNVEEHIDAKYFEEAWKYYFRVRKTSAEVNKTFSGLVKFIHMTNMLMLMYFMLTVVMKQQTIITSVLFLYDITMVVLFYVSGTMINDVNDDARKWIKDNAIPTSPIEVDGRTLQILLDDIRQAPIGIGTGIWFLDGGLIQRFVGLVSSLLMFMLDAESEPEALNDNVV